MVTKQIKNYISQLIREDDDMEGEYENEPVDLDETTKSMILQIYCRYYVKKNGLMTTPDKILKEYNILKSSLFLPYNPSTLYQLAPANKAKTANVHLIYSMFHLLVSSVCRFSFTSLYQLNVSYVILLGELHDGQCLSKATLQHFELLLCLLQQNTKLRRLLDYEHVKLFLEVSGQKPPFEQNTLLGALRQNLGNYEKKHIQVIDFDKRMKKKNGTFELSMQAKVVQDALKKIQKVMDWEAFEFWENYFTSASARETLTDERSILATDVYAVSKIHEEAKKSLIIVYGGWKHVLDIAVLLGLSKAKNLINKNSQTFAEKVSEIIDSDRQGEVLVSEFPPQITPVSKLFQTGDENVTAVKKASSTKQLRAVRAEKGKKQLLSSRKKPASVRRKTSSPKPSKPLPTKSRGSSSRTPPQNKNGKRSRGK